MSESREIPEKILSFEEFRKKNDYGQAEYNNFPAFFKKNKNDIERPAYENNPYYQQFLKEHPEKASKLSELVEKLSDLRDEIDTLKDLKRIDTSLDSKLEEIEKALYDAYVIMRNYGALDFDLFK